MPATDLPPGSVAEFDLYIKTRDGPSRYLEAGQAVTAAVRKALDEAGIEAVYIPYRVLGPFAQKACKSARTLLSGSDVSAEARAVAVRAAGVAVSRHLVANPGPASIRTAQYLAQMTAAEAMEEPESLPAFIKLTYVTYALNKHFVNASYYSLAVCAAIGMDDSREVLAIVLAGLLFDIGMAKLPEQTDAAASNENNPVVRQHVFVGRELLHGVQGMPRQVHDAALSHHERWDGSGYPSGLAGEEIPRAARIAAAVDVFDMLTTDRPGVKRMTPFDALSLMRRRMEGQFDPAILEALILGLSGQATFSQ